MSHDTLAFVHRSDPPPTDLTVYADRTWMHCGVKWIARVVGNSHYVSVPALSVHELSSCEPIEGPAERIPLDRTVEDRTVERSVGDVRVETRLEHRPLADRPALDSVDLGYRFAPDAITTIDRVPRGIETYHTYPEHDLTVYSRTRLEHSNRES